MARLLVRIGIASLLGIASAAHAQWESGQVWSPGEVAMRSVDVTGTFVSSAITQQVIDQNAVRTTRQTVAPAPRIDMAAAHKSFDFVPSPSARTQTWKALFKEFTITDPAAKAQVEAILAKPIVFTGIDTRLKPFGMSSANLADIQAAWMLYAYLTANDIAGEPTPRQARGVRDQVVQFLATGPTRTIDATQRQALADTLAFNLTLLFDAQKELVGKRDQQKMLRQYARVISQTKGFDIGRIRLTENGFAALR